MYILRGELAKKIYGHYVNEWWKGPVTHYTSPVKYATAELTKHEILVGDTIRTLNESYPELIFKSEEDFSLFLLKFENNG